MEHFTMPYAVHCWHDNPWLSITDQFLVQLRPKQVIKVTTKDRLPQFVFFDLLSSWQAFVSFKTFLYKQKKAVNREKKESINCIFFKSKAVTVTSHSEYLYQC